MKSLNRIRSIGMPATIALVILGLLSFCSTVHAALLAYEPFTNTPGTAIISSSDGFGFSAAWQANSSSGVATNTSYGLSYTDGAGHTLMSAPGAGFFQGSTTATTAMQPNRPFSFGRATNGEAATTWISLLIVRQGPTNGTVNNPYARGVNVTFDYPNSGSGTNQRVGIGNSSGAATNTVGILSAGGNLRPSANPPYQFGGSYGAFAPITNLVVLRIDHIAGNYLQPNDNAYLWVNPTNLAVEPGLSTATTNVLGLFDYSIGLVRVFVGGQDNGNNRPYGEAIVDEIRIGETYADVTPYGNASNPPPVLFIITNVQRNASSIMLSGTGGTSSGTYLLLANANLAIGSTNWPAVATNTFDVNGNFALTHPVSPAAGEQFYRLRIAPPPAAIPPFILDDPDSLTVTQGQTAAFSVTAGGTAPLSYQWLLNTNTTLSGQTASNLTFLNAHLTNTGNYAVRVSNAGGSITSAVATLTVFAPPSITTHPQGQTVLVSNNVLLTVVATGTATLGYQWHFNSNPLTDKTNSTLNLLNVTTNDTGPYFVTVSNLYGSTNSNIATLTVNEPNTNGDFFVSPTGNDANPGTIGSPFATLNKAISVVQPGNIIIMRGGTYFPNATIVITNSGTALNRIQLLAYPGETPYLNFTNQPYGSNNRGLLFPTNASYWTVKGLEIGYAGDNAVKVEGSHHRFEQCVFHHNGDSGLQIGFGHPEVNNINLAAFIEVINCDSYLNYDSDNNGADADGFAAKLHCGQGIVFHGCRAWENSDDSWDLFETDASVVISNCWGWKSGIGQGNGNGFKLGGNGEGGDSEGTHYAYNCISFGHKAAGFTQNSHKDGLVVISCLSFTNGSSTYNYFMEGSLNSGKQNVFKNNVGIRRNGASAGNNFIADNSPLEQNNSWNLAVTPNWSDYGTLLESAAKAPRQPDGSLPTGFARLVGGSDLIDQGVDVGIPFNGSAPDLGPYEYSP